MHEKNQIHVIQYKFEKRHGGSHGKSQILHHNCGTILINHLKPGLALRKDKICQAPRPRQQTLSGKEISDVTSVRNTTVQRSSWNHLLKLITN